MLQLPSLLNRNFPSNEHMFSMGCDCWPMPSLQGWNLPRGILDLASGDQMMKIKDGEDQMNLHNFWCLNNFGPLLDMSNTRQCLGRFLQPAQCFMLIYATANVGFHGHTSRNSPVLQQLTRKASQKVTILRYQCQLWVYHLNHISYYILNLKSYIYIYIYCYVNHYLLYIHMALCITIRLLPKETVDLVSPTVEASAAANGYGEAGPEILAMQIQL